METFKNVEKVTWDTTSVLNFIDLLLLSTCSAIHNAFVNVGPTI